MKLHLPPHCIVRLCALHLLNITMREEVASPRFDAQLCEVTPARVEEELDCAPRIVSQEEANMLLLACGSVPDSVALSLAQRPRELPSPRPHTIPSPRAQEGLRSLAEREAMHDEG